MHVCVLTALAVQNWL